MTPAAEVLKQAQALPVDWLEKTFGCGLWKRQCEIIESFATNPETYVPSAHATGKSYTAAHAVLWALYTHPWAKVVTTASSYHQVVSILWAELRQAWQRAKIPLGGPEPNLTELELGPGWSAVGMSTDNPVRMQGVHARGGVFMIVDEADGIPDEIWQGIRANLSTGECHLLAIGNPVDPQSYFAKKCSASNVSVLPINAFDTPNFTAYGLVLEDFVSGAWQSKITGPLPAPYLISPQWVADSLRDEGGDINSPFFLSRVRAIYPDMSEDSLIQQAWIEKAWNNWRDDKCGGPRVAWGVDVARYGDDKTVLAKREGGRYRIVDTGNQMDSEEVSSMVLKNYHMDRIQRGGSSRDKAPVAIDVIGVGAGVYDRLKKDVPSIAVESAGSPECTCSAKSDHKADCSRMKYLNKRAEMWWLFREALRLGEVALDPNDRQLARELVCVKYKINKGKVQIEEKSEIKKRLGKSPDRADAIVYASITDRSSVTGWLEAMRAV